MPEWTASGYDTTQGDRWLYGFSSEKAGLIKFGLVLAERRLVPRLAEVRRRSGFPDLTEIWRAPLHGVTHEQAEHIEAAARLWLTGSAGFEFIGAVDWLRPPIGTAASELVGVLDVAVAAARVFGR